MKIKAVIAYDGSRYAGYEKQINAKGIQSCLEKALSTIHKEPSFVVAAGRTDAKVHALGQVIHFDSKFNIPPEKYVQAFNTLLPKDIRMVKAEYADDDFHARFSSKKKRYDYLISYEEVNPFIEPYKAVFRRKLDVEAMRKAATAFMGEHDFISFTHAKLPEGKSSIKNVNRLDIVEEENGLRLIFEANGFLRYQVRMMTGALIAVGQHFIEPEKVKEMLEAKNKHACRYNAPAQGLYLVKVFYEDDF